MNKKTPKRTQIKVDVDPEFLQTLRVERERRALTGQELITRAIRLYCSIPESVNAHIFAAAISRGSNLQNFFLPPDIVDTGFASLGKGSGRRALRKLPTTELPPDVIEDMARFAEAFRPASRVQENTLEGIALLVFELLKQFPEEKVRLIVDALQIDARYYKSARIVPESKK